MTGRTWTTLRRALPVGILLTCVAISGSGAERPSLEALEAAVCEKADVDGDTYRPRVCDAACSCAPDTVAYASACSEPEPGTFELTGDTPTLGTCGSLALTGCFQPEGWCSTGSYQTCVDTPSCPAGEVCAFYNGITDTGVCLTACTTVADCTPEQYCSLGGAACAVDADCRSGESCEQVQTEAYNRCSGSNAVCNVDANCPPGETCVNPPLASVCLANCTTDADCTTGFNVTLSDVDTVAPATAGPATCSRVGGFPEQEGPINQNDAIACLAAASCSY